MVMKHPMHRVKRSDRDGHVNAALCIKRTSNLAAFCSVVNHNAAMQDKTINSALLALRKQGGQQGKLAEGLLDMRGVELSGCEETWGLMGVCGGWPSCAM
jgi:hypothetical protein